VLSLKYTVVPYTLYIQTCKRNYSFFWTHIKHSEYLFHVRPKFNGSLEPLRGFLDRWFNQERALVQGRIQF